MAYVPPVQRTLDLHSMAAPSSSEANCGVALEKALDTANECSWYSACVVFEFLMAYLFYPDQSSNYVSF